MSETNQPRDHQLLIGDLQISWKELTLFVPTLTAALAMSYDVGYFVGADLRFFTFFTLSEHLVFALQGLPLIVGLLVYVLIAAIPSEVIFPAVSTNVRKSTVRLSPMVHMIVAFTALTLLVLIAALFVYLHLRSLIALVGLAMAVISLRRENPHLLLPVVVPSLFLVSFLMGLDFSRLDRFSPWVAHSIDMNAGPALDGKIVRAGERGILVYLDDVQQYRLLRWDGVKAVHSFRQDSNFEELAKRYLLE